MPKSKEKNSNHWFLMLGGTVAAALSMTYVAVNIEEFQMGAIFTFVLSLSVIFFIFIFGLFSGAYRRRQFIDYPIALALILAVPAMLFSFWAIGKAFGDAHPCQTAYDELRIYFGGNEKPLFSVDLEFESHLDNGVISEELRQKFAENEAPLSQQVKASVEPGGTGWLITDKLKKYSVKKEKGSLNIYAEEKSHYLKEVFFKRGPIPYLIVLAFWTAVFALLLQFREVRREIRLKMTDVDRVIKNRPTYKVEQAAEFASKVENKLRRFRDTAFVKRMLTAFNRINRTQSSVGVDSLLDSMSAVDAQTAEASQRYVHFLIYLMPALGFIGTILGMGGGLKAFTDVIGLKTVAEIAIKMGPVIKQMGVAFDTTLLGLIGSAIVYMGATSIGKRCDELLVHLDSDSYDLILSRLEFRDPSLGQVVERLEAVCEQLTGKTVQDRMEDLAKTIEGANKFVGDFKASAEGLKTELEEVNNSCTTISETVKNDLGKSLTGFVSDLKKESGKAFVKQGKAYLRSSSEVAEKLNTACEEYSRQLGSVSKVFEKMAEYSRNGLMSKVEASATRLNEISTVVEGLREGVSSLRQSIMELSKQRSVQPKGAKEAVVRTEGPPADAEPATSRKAARARPERRRRGLLSRLFGRGNK